MDEEREVTRQMEDAEPETGTDVETTTDPGGSGGPGGREGVEGVEGSEDDGA